MEETAQLEGFVAYTLVQPELREMIREEAVRLDLRIVDIMGPMMQAFIDTFDDAPEARPGLLHQLDEDSRRSDRPSSCSACRRTGLSD
jgi:regulator of PEP synthase PpsR (kinase-PPPase family)